MKERLFANVYLYLVMVFTGVLITGCYPKGAEGVADLVTILTDYDKNFNFSDRQTYFMPDSVNYFGDSDNFLENLVLKYEDDILNKVESNMDIRGYTRLDTTSTEPPDMFLGIDIIASSYSGINWIRSYPGWGYYPSSWGWGGYGYYYPVGYSYDIGTVIVSLTDPNQIDPDTQAAKLVWFAALDGILSSREDITRNMVLNGIDQAFDQSFYIQSDH